MLTFFDKIQTQSSLVYLKQTVMMIVAAFIYAVAIKYFIIPAQVVLTGFEGISLSISYFTDNPKLFILLYAIFQCILIIFSVFKISKRFSLFTFILVSTVIYLLYVLPHFTFAQPEPEKERLILVVFGGLLMGTAKALALKFKGSAGDEDILSAYFAQKWLKPVGIIGIYAGIVSTLFGLVLAYMKNFEFEPVINTLMYTSIYIFISAETLNILFKKFRLTKLIIITVNKEMISEALETLSKQKTYTIEEGIGGFSKKPQSIISTILPHEDLNLTVAYIKKQDPKCFLYYHDIEGLSGRIHIDPIGK